MANSPTEGVVLQKKCTRMRRCQGGVSDYTFTSWRFRPEAVSLLDFPIKITAEHNINFDFHGVI